MNTPLISVIVPVYNTVGFLERCFDSIIAQTYTNIEIIIIDDGSTDGSSLICDEYAEQDSRCKVIHKKNEGVSKARNEGLKIANGDFICFIDSDDFVEKILIEELYHLIVDTKSDLAVCTNNLIINGLPTKKDSVCTQLVLTREEALEEVLLSRKFVGGPCGKLFVSENIKGLAFPEDIYFGEDLVFVVQAILNSKRIVVTPKKYYNYFMRAGSATLGPFNDKRYTDVISRKRVFELIEKENNFKLTELAHVSIVLADLAMLQHLFYDKSAQKKYCKDIQNRIREKFKFKRMKYVNTSIKINMLSAVVSYKVFFIVLRFKNLVKKIIKKS